MGMGVEPATTGDGNLFRKLYEVRKQELDMERSLADQLLGSTVPVTQIQ